MRRYLTSLIAIQTIIENNTRMIRNKRVLLDVEVARLYEVDVEYLRKQIEKEKTRFPKDFMFQLTAVECKKILNNTKEKQLPYVFTESGIMMIGGVLNTKKAIKIHIQIIEHFVQLYKQTMQESELMDLINLDTKNKETKDIFIVLQQLLK